MFPGKYQSDFAIQVTSQIQDAQQFAINFSNNNLSGSANFLPAYKTSKTRICVTVGMMTTGYDCTDILNLGLFRPIFSPTDFIQIKGRGTRKHNFLEQLFDDNLKDSISNPQKSSFKLFDFFANCEYFEEEFNYDEVLKLPRPTGKGSDRLGGTGPVVTSGAYEHKGDDVLAEIKEEPVGWEGMKIDRMFFNKFEETVRENDFIAKSVENGQWDRVIDYVNREVFDRPEEYYNLDKLRKAAAVDRRLTLREILEKIFGLIPRFKSRMKCWKRNLQNLYLTGSRTRQKQYRPLKPFLRHMQPAIRCVILSKTGITPILPQIRSFLLVIFETYLKNIVLSSLNISRIMSL